MILVADTRSSASLSQDNARGQNRFSLSLFLSNLRFYIYIFNVIVVNRSPSDPKRATYNRIVFIWDPWMLRSSEEDREGELGEFVVTRKKNASFRFLWREEGEVGVSGVY